MYYLLYYDVIHDYPARREAFRADHLKYAHESVERGELLLGGALAEPIDGAVLLFRGESADVAAGFAVGDPYVKSGLVVNWKVREWTIVVGAPDRL